MGKLVTYNIIGDIHGRSVWKELVDDNAINVFVGDYFDPYQFQVPISPAQTVENFIELMEYGKTHQCVFLYGNHDLLEYVWDCEGCGRRQPNYLKVKSLFEEYKVMFHGLAYSIGNKYLVTHAGVSEDWFKFRCEHQAVYGLRDESAEPCEVERTPDAIAAAINKLFKESKDGTEFTLGSNKLRFSDYYGETSTNGPLWYRCLPYHNVFGEGTEYVQVHGHTQQEFGIRTYNMKEDRSDRYVSHNSKVVNVDCLGYKPMSYKITIEE